MAERLLVDFDNTIHNPDDKYQDAFPEGRPVTDALRCVQQLQKQFQVVVFTANPPHKWDAIKQWLKDWGFGDMGVTNIKLQAYAYVDNRAVNFQSWAQVMRELDRLAPKLRKSRHGSPSSSSN